MSDLAIAVEDLAKVYRVGARRHGESLREAIVHGLRSRFTRLTGDGLLRDPNTVWALDGVDVEVPRGQALGIIGRNGAGKSTFLKVLSRITAPTRGRVELYGRAASLLEVGTGFHYELTGRENVYLNGAVLGMSKGEIARKFDAIVEFSGVERFIDTPVKRYSSGMMVRLAFAVAAHLEPEIMLVDEVLAVGDQEFRKKSLEKMRAVAERGETVLFVSHNMAAIRTLCQRCLLFSGGRVERDGDAVEVVRHYLGTIDERTADLFAARKQRSLEGRARFVGFHLEGDGGQRVTKVRSGGACTAVFEVEAREAVDDVNVQLTLYDDTGTGLAHVNNTQTRRAVHLRRGIQQVRCTLPALPFTPGTYSFSIALFRGLDQFDRLAHILGLDVLPDPDSPDAVVTARTPPVILERSWETE